MKRVRYLICIILGIILCSLFTVSDNSFQFTPTIHFKDGGNFFDLERQCFNKIQCEHTEADLGFKAKMLEKCLADVGWHVGGLKIGQTYIRFRPWVISLITHPKNDGRPFTYKAN